MTRNRMKLEKNENIVLEKRQLKEKRKTVFKRKSNKR